MDVLYDFLLVLLILVLFTLLAIMLRRRLLASWREVSAKEIIFHRMLSRSIRLFYAQKDKLKNEDNRLQFVRLGRSRKKKMRYLLLKERQELYLAVSDIYNEIEENNTGEFTDLMNQFEELQKARRLYNSKVLVYNQSISIFPTRFLAMRMGLKIKEYFG